MHIVSIDIDTILMFQLVNRRSMVNALPGWSKLYQCTNVSNVANVSTMSNREPSALDKANDLLAPLIPRLLAAFASYRGIKRAPQSMRSLQPLALVFLLEAFGLAFLLTEEQRTAAWAAARGPGRKSQDDYDPTEDHDTEEAKALRWVAARAAAVDSAYRAACKATIDDAYRGYVKSWAPRKGSIKLLSRDEYAPNVILPNRGTFEAQWGERNPIDPATCPAAFDPRAQLSILDAVSPERDGVLGLFMAESRLRAEAPPVLVYAGHELDLTGCSSLADAAWRAISERWIVYLDHRGATVGLRLLPPTEGIRVRLRAPLVNVIAPDVEPLPSSCPNCHLARDGFETMVGVSTRAAKAATEFFDHVAAGPPETDDPLEPFRTPATPEQRAACPHPPGNRMPLSGDGWFCEDCGADVDAPPPMFDPNDPTTEGAPRELTEHDGFTPDGHVIHEPDATPAQPTADQASFRSASRKTLDRAAEAAGEPRERKVKPGKTKASGAESKIRKGKKRAAK